MSAEDAGHEPDHMQIDLGDAAAVSDRGQRHHNNEDAVALVRSASPVDSSDSPIHVAVVCDGVSSAPGSKDASRLAADVAAEVLAGGITTGEIPGDAAQTRALVVAAVAAGAEAVGELAASGTNAPATTMVVALVEHTDTGARVHLGWLGDSRAYWLPAADSPHGGAPRVLTRDHTVAAEYAAAASLPADRVDSLPGAHVITRWLGADARASDPELDTVDLAGPGLLVVCTDGLWNYFAAPDDLAAAIGPDLGTGVAPLGIAEQLTHLANRAGGHDNITVAIIPIGAGRTEQPDRSE